MSDEITLQAALLHDVLEENNVSKEEKGEQTMKTNNNLRTMKEEETRKTNGGSVAALLMGLAIAAPYAEVAWNMGQSIGQAIVKRRK